MSPSNSRVFTFSTCNLTFEIRCREELAQAVSYVVGSFTPSGSADHLLNLELYRGSDPLPTGTVDFIRRAGRRTDIHLPDASHRSISIAVANALVEALSHNQGLLLHAAGLLREERAYVFLGRSGAGKTTLAQGAGGMICVHDDNVAVRRRSDGWWAYGVPTLDNSGRPGSNAAGRLRGLYLIERGNRLEVLEPGRSDMLDAFPQHVIVPFQDPDLRKRISETMLTLLAEVKAWRLRFFRGSDVAAIV